MTTILWLKAFHVFFMVAWFSGIFYLPRIFVNHAESKEPLVHQHFKGMERRLLYFVTPFALLTVLLGLVKIFADDKNTRSGKFYRFFNEIPVIILLIIVILAYIKPF